MKVVKKKRKDNDDDNQRAMSKWAGPDYKGRWEMKDLLLDFFQTLLALQGVTSQSVNEIHDDQLCTMTNTQTNYFSDHERKIIFIVSFSAEGKGAFSKG